METIIRRLEQATMLVAALSVVAIMLIVGYDAIGRYVFRAPLPWAQDLVASYLMVIVTYFALSSTQTHRDHVSIDLLTVLLPKRIQAYIEAVVSLVAAAVFGIIAYGVSLKVIEAYSANTFFAGYILWPVWLSYLPIAIGSALLVLRLLADSYSLLRYGEDSTVNLSHHDEVVA